MVEWEKRTGFVEPMAELLRKDDIQCRRFQRRGLSTRIHTRNNHIRT